MTPLKTTTQKIDKGNMACELLYGIIEKYWNL